MEDCQFDRCCRRAQMACANLLTAAMPAAAKPSKTGPILLELIVRHRAITKLDLVAGTDRFGQVWSALR